MCMFNYAAKYHFNKHSFFAQYMAPNQNLLFAYQLRLQKRAFLVSELEVNTAEGETKSVMVIIFIENLLILEINLIYFQISRPSIQ